ncbi:MAG: signal recognition particle-docking protein FtsY, partial [Candidatus Aenigmarchaeota archaeon]|nr:signal recognition particle-docking protein FtsY [Candidatus Aenigmarchaeota archaeon]
EKSVIEEMKENETRLVHEKEGMDLLAEEHLLKKAQPDADTIEKREAIIEEKKGLFRGLIKKVSEKRLEEKDIENVSRELRLALLENDVALETADKIVDDLKKGLAGKSVSRGKTEAVIRNALKAAMLDVLNQERIDIEDRIKEKSGEPFLVMFLGFNGSGKTTSLAKTAHKFKDYTPVLAAGDTFRAASIEQLEEHGKKLHCRVIKHTYGSDSAAVIFDAKKHAKAAGNRLVLADTAGRSHANVNLMDELKKICRVNKPDLKILVLDSLTGNDIYDQVKLFNDAVGIDGIILSKADVYDKGGAALSAAHTSKKPILFLGTGQEYDDLKEFNPNEIVENLLE